MFDPNRYKQIPSSNLSAHPRFHTGPYTKLYPQLTLNVNLAFGPFENLKCITYGQMNLVNEMRYLWLQMVIWSRSIYQQLRSEAKCSSCGL